MLKRKVTGLPPNEFIHTQHLTIAPSADATLSGIELCRMLKKGQHINSENSHAFEQFYALAA